MSNSALTPLIEFVAALWHRKLLLLIPWVLGMALGLGATYLFEPRYEASTLILVEGQKVPAEYVKTTVTSEIEERLKTLQHQITNRTNLQSMIKRAELYSDLWDEVPMEDLVERAKGALTLRVERNRVIRISFRGSDPEKVAAVANLVGDMFIEENLKLRANQAENTTVFLESELRATKEQLEIQEARLSEFRLESRGMLPSQRESNLRALDQLQTKVEINRGALERLELKKALLQQQPDAVVTQASPDQPAGSERLKELTRQLQSLQLRYTDQHPDIVRLKSEIEQLRQAAESRPTPIADATPKSGPRSIKDAELAQVDNEVKRLREEQQRLLNEAASYQARLEGTPKVEQRLSALTRDYTTLRRSYESLLEKRTEARLAENLEKKQQSEQFISLEEAIPPTVAAFPNRPLFFLGGGALGLLVGIGLALLREQLDETFEVEDGLRKSFPGLPFVVSIPHLHLESDANADEAESEPGVSTA